MFGIAKDIRSEVRVCTPDLLNAALDSVQVAKVCAEKKTHSKNAVGGKSRKKSRKP